MADAALYNGKEVLLTVPNHYSKYPECCSNKIEETLFYACNFIGGGHCKTAS